MVANLEDVNSVSVYKHIGDLTGEEKKTDGIYDPGHVSQCTSPREKLEAARLELNSTSEQSPTTKTPPSELEAKTFLHFYCKNINSSFDGIKFQRI